MPAIAGIYAFSSAHANATPVPLNLSSCFSVISYNSADCKNVKDPYKTVKTLYII